MLQIPPKEERAQIKAILVETGRERVFSSFRPFVISKKESKILVMLLLQKGNRISRAIEKIIT